MALFNESRRRCPRPPLNTCSTRFPQHLLYGSLISLGTTASSDIPSTDYIRQLQSPTTHDHADANIAAKHLSSCFLNGLQCRSAPNAAGWAGRILLQMCSRVRESPPRRHHATATKDHTNFETALTKRVALSKLLTLTNFKFPCTTRYASIVPSFLPVTTVYICISLREQARQHPNVSTSNKLV